MHAVLDPNVIVSALLSPAGTPAGLLLAWLDGAFELVASPALLAELQRVLAYPKIAARVGPAEAQELLDLLRVQADLIDDPVGAPTVRSPDPDDDYLLHLAEIASAALVSGDSDLHSLARQIPVYTPKAFLDLLNRT